MSDTQQPNSSQPTSPSPQPDPQHTPYAPEPQYAQPPYVQPQYAQPSPQPGYPYPTYPAATAAGSLGRVAFFIALATAAISLLFILITPLVFVNLHGQYGLYEAISLTRSILSVILGAIALVLGIIAARRGSQPVLAGIAIGIGGVEVLGTILSLASNLLYGILL